MIVSLFSVDSGVRFVTDMATVVILENDLNFVGDTPHAVGDEVTVMFNANSAVMSASCDYTRLSPMDCECC